MIWHYFPIGMRFPVDDFSEDTKRACWRIALSAAFASDASATGLFEACDPFDPISESPVYICIVCYAGIKQARVAGKTMHALSRLLTRLCLYNPLVQANYLESFGPYLQLGTIDETGRLVPEEAGTAFLPTEAILPMQKTVGPKLLLALASETGNAEQTTRLLGTTAADAGFRVRRMPLAFGGRGTVQALLSACGGRYETLTCEDENGTRSKRIVGIVPGPIAVIETDASDGNATVGQLIQKTLDLGFRHIRLASDSEQSVDARLDERLSETELVLLNGKADRVLNRIGLSEAAQKADYIATNRPALFPDHPHVIALTDGDGLSDGFREKGLPLIGKGVANATDL